MLWRRSRLGDQTLKLVKAKKSSDFLQNNFAWLSGLIPEQRHGHDLSFPETKPWPVNGTALAMLCDFHFSAR